MAYFTVRNSRNPHKAISCGITYKQLVDKNNYDGELIWVLEVATDEPHKNGGSIPSYFITVTEELDLDLEIEKAVSYISTQVDWGTLIDDIWPPEVEWFEPATYISKITDDVRISLIDLHPSYGIDIDSIQMFVNGIEVTDDLSISGDEYNYIIRWVPPSVTHEQLD